MAKHFNPTPRQLRAALDQIEQDQLTQPAGPFGTSFLDNNGQASQTPQMDPYIVVEIITDPFNPTVGELTDSNGNYFCQKRDTWFGPLIQAYMRLEPIDGITFEVGDKVLGCLTSMTNDSPNPDDQGWPLVTPLIWNAIDTGNQLFEIAITGRQIGSIGYCDSNDPQAAYLYAWDECGGTGTGSLAAQITITKIQTADGLNPTIYDMDLENWTNGTYTLTEDGGSPSGDIVYNADPSGDLSEFTVTGTYPHWVLTGIDGSDHTLTADYATTAKPKHPHYPLIFLNLLTPMCYPVNVYAKLYGGDDPTVEIEVTQEADPDGTFPIPMIWKFTRQDLVEGQVNFVVDSGSPIVTEADDDAATLQTLISATLAVTVVDAGGGHFTITCTADDDAHTMSVSTTNEIGSQVYEVVWSNGNSCCAAFGGVDMKELEGYAGPPEVDASISPSGSSVGPWTITISGADSGFYDITVDGGDPISTAFGACPTIAGFTTSTDVDGNCVLTGDGMTSYTINLYPARLRSNPPKQVPYIDPTTGCQAFLSISSEDC